MIWVSESTKVSDSDAIPMVLNRWLSHAEKHGASAKGLFVRRRFVQLSAVQAQASEMFLPKEAVYDRGTATWTFPSGGTLKLRHAFDRSSAQEFQGQNFSMIIMGETRDWPDNSVLMDLSQCLSREDGITSKLISFSES
jgi:hypothetical protein